jgi:type I restriction enzyme S subunit
MYSTTGAVPYFTGPSDFTHEIQGVTKWTAESANIAKRHDTLITVKGSGVGEICYLTLPSVAMGRQLMAVRAEGGDPRFIYQFLSTRRAQFEALASGNLIPGLSRGDILGMRAYFPSPDEQQRIADCLSSLDNFIAAEGRKLETLRQHKQGMMQQLFPQPGETAPRLRLPEFVNTAWEPRALGMMVSETERPIVMDDEREYALVTVKRRYGGVVARNVLKGKAISVKSQFLIEPNDFLVSKRQIVHDACVLVPAELGGSIVSNEYSVLTAKTGCDIDFFNYFTQQPCVSDSFLQSSVGIVIEKMLFKLDWWLKLAFPFPSLAEQRRIAACLSSLDALLASHAQKLDGLKRHKQGLLQHLLPEEEGH